MKIGLHHLVDCIGAQKQAKLTSACVLSIVKLPTKGCVVTSLCFCVSFHPEKKRITRPRFLSPARPHQWQLQRWAYCNASVSSGSKAVREAKQPACASRPGETRHAVLPAACSQASLLARTWATALDASWALDVLGGCFWSRREVSGRGPGGGRSLLCSFGSNAFNARTWPTNVAGLREERDVVSYRETKASARLLLRTLKLLPWNIKKSYLAFVQNAEQCTMFGKQGRV